MSEEPSECVGIAQSRCSKKRKGERLVVALHILLTVWVAYCCDLELIYCFLYELELCSDRVRRVEKISKYNLYSMNFGNTFFS